MRSRDSPASSPRRPGTGFRSSSCYRTTPTCGVGYPECTSETSSTRSTSASKGSFQGSHGSDRRDTLIELERFNDSHGSDRLASFIWERLEGGVDGEVVNQLFEATGELGQNVVEHAGSPVGGFIAAQRYKAAAPEERIVVAVGDVGVGIRESLRTRYGDMTDAESIRRAIQWHVSRVPDEGRGQGLPGVVDGVRGLGGTVWIRSGAASRTVTRGHARTSEVSRLQGTTVGARLPCRPGR